MRVVIIAERYYPMNAPRANRAKELAEEFARRGDEVFVVTLGGKFDYQIYEREHDVKIVSIGEGIFGIKASDGFVAHRRVSRVLKFFFHKLFRMPDVFVIPKVIKTLGDISLSKGDLLVSIAAPHTIHWSVALARHKSLIRPDVCWVADCGDPFFGNPVLRPPWYFKFVERFWLSLADFVTIPDNVALVAYESKFHSKFRVLPQAFKIVPITKKVLVEGGAPVRFCYAGTIYEDIRNPDAFLRHLGSLNIELEFVVYTKSHDFFERYRSILGSRLHVKHYVPREHLLEIMSAMDFLVDFVNQSAVQVPSKLIDYAIAGRPVLSVDLVHYDQEKTIEFLNRNYMNKSPDINIDDYDIEVVVDKLRGLVKQHEYAEN